MTKKMPRLLIAAPASSSGKTMVTCGILRALKKRGLSVQSFKCGPDYIDPMFHREVLGVPGYSLDSFLCGCDGVKKILAEHAEEDILSVVEGVMGYYDGIAGISTRASTYEIAAVTQTPSVLVVDARGASLSIVPQLQGLTGYRKKEDQNGLKGVILNRISTMMYGRLKKVIEEETSLNVYGYVPELSEAALESRHLGLKMPGEIEKFQEKTDRIAQVMEETLDLDALIRLAYEAPDIVVDGNEKCSEFTDKVKIGVARDEAFCFIYPENLRILEKEGADLVYFSPVHDRALPNNIRGLVFYGGYPELYAEQLSANETMKKSIRTAIESGIPCIAECGGFQYLQEGLEDCEGNIWPMAGVLKGKSFFTASLKRFGYLFLKGGKVFGTATELLTAHEFHYYDSEACGDAFCAQKPLTDRSWKCMFSTDTMLAGYPHFHYVGNPQIAEAFVERCRKI